jgi:alkylation response protein AidB-like acyl-CoA dehydrogenase
MDFTFSQDQEALRAAVRDVLARRFGAEQRLRVLDGDRVPAEELWSEIVGLGWHGLLVPEHLGGLGLGFVDLAVVQEELGRVAAPVPFLSSAVLATRLARLVGLDELVRDLAAGRVRATVALDEPGHGDPLRHLSAHARLDGKAATLSGTKPFVLDGDRADVALVAARDADGLGTYMLESPRGAPAPALDLTRPFARVQLDGRSAVRVGPPGDHEPIWRRLLDEAAVALAAELVGVSERAFDLAVDYAKQRVQFDRPIASFQVTRHKAADMLHRLELMRVGAHYAAWAADAEEAALARAAAMAKGYAGEAAVWVAGECIQVHGGVGFTWDVECHVLFRRAKQDDLMLGAGSWQRRRLAAMVVDEAGEQAVAG